MNAKIVKGIVVPLTIFSLGKAYGVMKCMKQYLHEHPELESMDYKPTKNSTFTMFNNKKKD